VSLITQKTNLGSFLEGTEKDPNADLSVLQYVDDLELSFFDNELDFSSIDKFSLLAKLAAEGKQNAYNLIYDDFKKFFSGGYILLPDNKVFAAGYERYDTAADPGELKARISSGAEANSDKPAWPHGEEGYLEPHSGMLSEYFESGEAKYDLSELTYEKISSCVRSTSDGIEIQLRVIALDDDSRNEFSFTDVSQCTGEAYGDRLRDPNFFYILIS
jgi:hypothetical protein